MAKGKIPGKAGEGSALERALRACAPGSESLGERWGMGLGYEELASLDPRPGEEAFAWLARALSELGEKASDLERREDAGGWRAALWAPLAPLGAAGWMLKELREDAGGEKGGLRWDGKAQMWALDALAPFGGLIDRADRAFGKSEGGWGGAGLVASAAAIFLLYPALALAGGLWAPRIARRRGIRRARRARELCEEGLCALGGEQGEGKRFAAGLSRLGMALEQACLGRWARLTWARGWALGAMAYGRRALLKPRAERIEGGSGAPGDWMLEAIGPKGKGWIAFWEALGSEGLLERVRAAAANAEAWAGVELGWSRGAAERALGQLLLAGQGETAARRIGAWAARAHEADGGRTGWESKGLAIRLIALELEREAPPRGAGGEPLDPARFGSELGRELPPGWGSQIASRWEREGVFFAGCADWAKALRAGEEAGRLEEAAGEATAPSRGRRGL